MSATRGGTDGAAADALRDWPAALAEGRYEPATIGVEPFAWELDGGGGAIDRFALVNTGHALDGIVANGTPRVTT